MRTFLLGLALAAGCVAPAAAQQYLEYPAPTPGYPFPRSVPTGRAVVIPPYEKPFPVRVYSTPPRQPYYNVPPYAVISPY